MRLVTVETNLKKAIAVAPHDLPLHMVVKDVHHRRLAVVLCHLQARLALLQSNENKAPYIVFLHDVRLVLKEQCHDILAIV